MAPQAKLPEIRSSDFRHSFHARPRSHADNKNNFDPL